MRYRNLLAQVVLLLSLGCRNLLMGVATELTIHVLGLHPWRKSNFRGDSLTVYLLPSSVPSPSEFDLCKGGYDLYISEMGLYYFNIAYKSRITWDCILVSINLCYSAVAACQHSSSIEKPRAVSNCSFQIFPSSLICTVLKICAIYTLG
jgi:hypothetical protein